jgi:spore coat polysaccharide biosynthesis protein SpsF
MKISSFITVRTSSNRLPQKCLLPFGNRNVIEHIIDRAKHYQLDPIICTSIDSSDDILEEIAKKEGVKVFRGSLVNKLKRWYDCCNHFSIKEFHTLDADDPFFDGELMKESMDLLNHGYDVVCPTKSSSAGNASVGYSLTREIIEKALKGVPETADTEMMWYYLDKIPGIRKIDLPEKNSPSRIIRLTLDYEEDYWLLSSIRRIVGNFASRAEVDALFVRNPDLYQINWFRNEQWASGQRAGEI